MYDYVCVCVYVYMCAYACRCVVGVRRVPARVVSATFGRFWGFGVGVGGGDDSVVLDFCKPKTPKLDSFSIQTRSIDAQDSEPRVVLHPTHSESKPAW